ncbi:MULTISPECIES: hypothetical protein [unclassified Pseudovibrio]|uniref:hypothetical protein n=1 Tax=unclassified Pseudovibrio TaxID=2627060 RepID=UPI001290308A|nr:MULTISPECIES: hypothetical protein [unclassified Pseudovibrio]
MSFQTSPSPSCRTERSGDPVPRAKGTGVGEWGSGSCIVLRLCEMTREKLVGVQRIPAATVLLLLQLFVDRWAVPFHIHM